MSNTHHNRKDLAAGAIFVLIGLVFFVATWRGLAIGTAFTMGPGYFPVVTSGLLMLLGLGVMARAVNLPDEPLGNWPWRAIVLVGACPVVFALTVDRLGMAVAIFLVCLMVAFASRRMTLRLALPVAAGLAAFCVVVFVWLLGLPIPVVGEFFRG